MSAYETDTDQLTGLLTRRALAAALDATAGRRHAPIAMLAVDVDGLKQLNDRYGHETADQLLAELACRLREPLGEDDLIGRIGGDEFLIVCRRICEEEQLAELAEALRRAVAHRPIRLEKIEIEATVTVGGTLVEPGVSTTEALSAADQQLYLAKQRAGSDAYDRVCELVVGLLEADGRTIETRIAAAVAEVALANRAYVDSGEREAGDPTGNPRRPIATAKAPHAPASSTSWSSSAGDSPCRCAATASRSAASSSPAPSPSRRPTRSRSPAPASPSARRCYG